MIDGYYWYRYSDKDDCDPFSVGRQAVVDVDHDRVCLVGNDRSFGLDEFHGEFVGPIKPPDLAILEEKGDVRILFNKEARVQVGDVITVRQHDRANEVRIATVWERYDGILVTGNYVDSMIQEVKPT